MKYIKTIFILFLGMFSCASPSVEESRFGIGKLIHKTGYYKQNKMRSLGELVDTNDSAFPILEELVSKATNKVELLPRDNKKAEECLLACQVTTHSLMGAIVYHTGGILIDNGWLRILGSGGDRMTRSLASWNVGKTYTKSMSESTFLLIADDAIGGFFALNAGALGNNMGNVYYFAPETLVWEDLEISYSQFISFVLSGNTAQFYETFRWKGWEDDVEKLSPDAAYSFVPFLWTKEGKDIDKCSKVIVPIADVYALNLDMNKKND